MVAITDCTSTTCSAGNVDLAWDSLNNRFLVTWFRQYDLSIHARQVNADGALYGSEIIVGHPIGYSDGSSCFDPVNHRFLHVWKGIRGQLINADGSLYGSELDILLDPPVTCTGFNQ